MALTVTRTDLLRYIGRKLGYGRGTLTGNKATDANDVLNDALRRFYEPLDEKGEKYQWSFLTPTVPFSFAENEWKYNLPSNYSMIHGPLTYEREQDACHPEIEITGAEKILARQQKDSSAGRPWLAAVRVKQIDQASPTSYELIVYPTSDAAYTVNLTYKINPYSLDVATALPHGGQAHSQTLVAAALAAAASFDEFEGDKYEAQFREQLRASISHDRQLRTPEYLGVNYDTSDATDIYDNRQYSRIQSTGNVVPYGGVTY